MPASSFTRLTGWTPDDPAVKAALLHGPPPPGDGPTSRELVRSLAGLLGMDAATAARALGLSRRAASRNDPPGVHTLDRLWSVCVAYDRAAPVFGTDTGAWFTAAHPALDGLSPLTLLDTRFGERYLHGFISAMLDGAMW